MKLDLPAGRQELVIESRNWRFVNKIFCNVKKFIPQLFINYFYHLPKAILAVLYYRYPAKDLTVIGVTGTDGKTTTATLIYEILKKAGLKTALVSTVRAKIGNLDLPTGLHITCPDPWELQRLLRLIANKKYKYVVLEVTSHGLDQYRVLGANFKIGVITNITHEHLDYHKNWENYYKAKAKLFKKVDYSILNIEDKSFKRLKKISKKKVVSYGMEKGKYNIKNYHFKTKLLGKFNQLNCLAAIAVAKILKINNKTIKKTILNFKGVIGRMEEINMGQDFKVFIDFAHTPNALENALQVLKKIPHNKLIAVFGCAGLRDFKKRPKMGKIACQLADKVFLTAEDPRTEDLNKIIKEIKNGCENKSKVIKIPDRSRAIETAIMQAKTNNIIGIFGKGHEQSMCFGKKEQLWSDHKAVKNTLLKKVNQERK